MTRVIFRLKKILLYLNIFLGWGWNSLVWWNWVIILWIGKFVGCRYPRVSSSIFIKIMIIIVIIDHLWSHLNWMGCPVEQISTQICEGNMYIFFKYFDPYQQSILPEEEKIKRNIVQMIFFSSVSKTTRELQLEWTKVRFIKILADLSYQCSTVGSIIAQLYSVVNIYHNLLPVQSRTVCFSTVHCILSY